MATTHLHTSGLPLSLPYPLPSCTVDVALVILWICAVLAVLEVSLSFDNAAVNASVLKDMDPVWQRRFLTWGIAIAVFGMRIVFPLVSVMIAASPGPLEAIGRASCRESVAQVVYNS